MPSSVTAAARTRTSSPDRRVDEPRRVVVAVAAARTVDEHDVLHLAAPAARAELVRQRAQRGAALLLHVRRHRIVRRRHGARARRVREDVHLRDAGALDRPHRRRERGVVLGREADDHVARQVELAGERREPPQVGVDRVAAAHRAQHAVVAGLQRHVQVLAHRRRLAERGDERVVHVVDLDRAEPQPLEAGRLPRLAHEARQVVARRRGRGSSRG